MNKIKNLTKRLLISALAVLSLTTLILGVAVRNEDNSAVYAAGNNAIGENAIDENTAADFIYLSDYDYVKELNGKKVSYSTKDECFDTGEEIVLNGCALKSNADGKISLATGGYDEDGYLNTKKYLKGITACAPSEVVFDISGFDYEWFSTYYGVDSKVAFAAWLSGAPENSAICKFYFYTSVDGETWNLESEENQAELKGYDEQAFIKFSVIGKKYIKLKAEPAYEGTQANHAVYANPILFKEGFVFDDTPYDFIKTVEECDEIIKSHSYDELLSNYEDIILTRKFVSFFGYDNLQDFAHVDERHKNVIKWILHNDLDALRYFVTAGMPNGFSAASNVAEVQTKILKNLYTLYTAHGEDINDTTALTYPPNFKESATLGDLYKRMIISLSITHANDIVFALCGNVSGNPPSDPLVRYEAYKKFHSNGWLKNEVFERLSVPEMMQVLNIEIRDDELEWLSWYVRVKKNGNLSCHAYMPYAGPLNGAPWAYRNPANYDTYNAKYNLSDFNLSYGEANVTRLWMLYEKGAWCGGISLNGMVIQKIVGVPSVVMSQYNHLAYLFQVRNADGEAAWASAYDIFGVANAAQAEGRAGSVTNWGSKSWNDPFKRDINNDLHAIQCTGSATYTHYVQYVLNDWENYVKAEEIRTLTDLYPLKFDTAYEIEDYTPKGENAEYSDELIEIFNEVLKYQPKHMYGWYGLINAYRENDNTTVEEYLQLAKRITENMYDHPFPMKDLLDLIEPKIKGTIYQLTFSNLIAEAYKKGSVLGTEIETDYLQPNVTRALAGRFLGLNQEKLEAATFSFDGGNARKIVLGKDYVGKDLAWDYSLDGGINWSSFTTATSVTLSADQIKNITQENGIKVHFNGLNYDAENCFTIKIGKAVLPSDSATNSLFANDLENRVVNVTNLYEWRYSGNDAWISYATASPDLSGNKSVEVRIGAYGTNLASDVRTFTFTEDVSAPHRKYIPVSRISLYEVSSQATGHAGNAIYALDANYNTRWHSNWNGADTQRFISIKLDKPTFLSSVEFVPAGGGNGKILDGTIYGSLDGVSWIKLAERKNLRYTNQCNLIADAQANIQSFDLENPQDVLYVRIVADRASNGNWFTARAFNFYEDTTQEHRPAASIIYSTTEPTRENVTITLKNLFPTEHITITNNGGSDTYTFTENGEFTFEFVNDQGKTGRATAIVNWIDRDPPSAEFVYSTTQLTNGTVVVFLNTSETVTVTNRTDIIYAIDEHGNVIDLTVSPGDNNENVLNGYTVDEEGFIRTPAGDIVANINPFRMVFTENGKFTFEFVDRAENKGSAEVVVDWIDKSPLNVALTYDKTQATNGNVTVTVSFDKLAEVTNNDGKLSYTFNENGEFTFEYVDAAGNVGSITAKVTWIDRIAPVATVNYDKTASTNQSVTATISFDKQGVTVTNNGGKLTYTFTENGEFIFEYVDAAGNAGSIKAKVDWIVSDVPISPGENEVVIECDKTQKDKAIVTITIPGKNVTFVDGNGTFEFAKNGTYEIKYYDEDGTLCSVSIVVDWLEESGKSSLPIIIGILVGVLVIAVAVTVAVVVIIKKRKAKV